MPHICIKLAIGKSDEQKAQLVQAIVKDAMLVASSEDAISVAIEEIEPKDWIEKVYKPDIQGKWETLYKKPGY